jgi:polar amino acid transport system substrate-binding protein
MEAIGQLAGGVAHDFNNILTVIQGYSELLKRSKNLDAHEREQVEEIFTSAERAAQLTHGLLAFSRKQALVMRHNNLNDIVQGVHKFLARTIGEDVTFQTTCSGPELPVIADKAQLEQVLINLATNARDAMLNGGSFTIKSELSVLGSPFMNIYNYSVPPGKYALLTVSDTGAGIKKEHLNHIFEPFFSTKEVGKGTGLGMAIIYGIIRQHNGFINVYSKVGEGTTIQIYLPIVEEGDKPKPASTTEVVVPAKGHETILVAEDEPAVRTLVAEVLTSVGYQVIVAEDGVDAIEKFKQYQDEIGLVLMDMIMPRKSGWEAYEDIQRIEPGIKVIFTSGYTADFIENRGVSDEGIDLIMKPVKPNELLIKIREALNK